MNIKILEAKSAEDIEKAGILFLEYANSLEIDLDFQDFYEEIESMPGKYAPPSGCIYLAYINDKLAGCAALRKFEEDFSEMKHLYVRPEYRGEKIGRELAESIISKAREIGYSHMRLDTLSSMEKAISLYISLGFKEVGPYYYNPYEGATYFELDLGKELGD